MKVMDTSRKHDGSFARSDWNWKDDSYYTQEYGFEESIDSVEALKDEEYIDHEAVSAELAYQGLLLGRESRVAEALYNTTTFTGSTNTLAITHEWDDATNAVPYSDVEAGFLQIRAKCAIPKSALTFITSDDNIEFICRTNEIKNLFQYNDDYGKMLKSGLDGKCKFLQAYFGVKRVIAVMSMYDTSNLESTASIGKFWSNEYAMLGYIKENNVNLKTQTLIKQLNWAKYSSNFIMEDYEEPSRNKVIIRAREYNGIKVNADYGFLFSNCKTTVDSTTGI
jgi:hypothetical protein